MIFNSHTHIGDAFISLEKKYSIEELFAPYGIKHRMLEKASGEEILNGIKKAIDIMEKCGTDFFVDFREGGIEGVKILKEALKGRKIKAIILGRPKNFIYDEKEIDELLDISDGIALSSVYDWDKNEIEMVANHVHERKKIFAIHASEVRREDVEQIISLKPKFVVHLCKASDEDIKKIVKEKIGVVICPRSNFNFNLSPPLEKLIEYKANIMLGTDNAMIVEPNIFEEMKFLIEKFDIEEEKAYDMISKNPCKFFLK
ncbi:MAG: amidohydrolase family protein [Thermoplasmatales archaeon]|nr:amidohydrolase family protein [Thermoplasmatales archaeon]